MPTLYPDDVARRRRSFILCLHRHKFTPAQISRRMGITISRVSSLIKHENHMETRRMQEGFRDLQTSVDRLSLLAKLPFALRKARWEQLKEVHPEPK